MVRRQPFLVLLGGVCLWGQGVTSDIRGTVSDSSGAAVAGATITINDVTKGWTRTVTSGAAGEYSVLQLPPADTFLISAEIQGFKKEVRSGGVLQTRQQSRIGFLLSPRQVSEWVKVTENTS